MDHGLYRPKIGGFLKIKLHLPTHNPNVCSNATSNVPPIFQLYEFKKNVKDELNCEKIIFRFLRVYVVDKTMKT